MAAMARNTKTFYGWYIVGACFTIAFVGAGIGFYSFSVFFPSLIAEFGWTRASVSLAVAAWALLMAFSSPLVGYLLERFGARRVIAAFAVLAGLSQVLLGQMNSMLQLVLILILGGFGMAGIVIIPNQTLIAHWFDRLRGRAMGIMMVGIGLGGFVFPPLSNVFIERFGWRWAFTLLGIIIWVVIIPVALLVIRYRPSDVGLLPDGDQAQEPGPEGSAAAENGGGATGLTLRDALRTPAFWLLFSAMSLMIFGGSGITVHFVIFLIDGGISAQQAANVWGLAIGISVVGRLLGGVLADRFPPKQLLTFTNALHGIAVFIIFLFFIRLEIHSLPVMLAFAFIYGLGLGGTATTMPVLAARCFGTREFSKIIGAINVSVGLGVVFGPLLAGKVYDRTHSYHDAFLVFSIGFLVAAMLVFLIRPPGRQSTAQEEASWPERLATEQEGA